ncbi:MAG TPA: AraC family transcriptional regulator, partial [Burkholderiaceae bacterium]|nr:AraC family transcriptional regulator [Burkholderiaceae bacterium]
AQTAPLRHSADRVCASGLPGRLERFSASAFTEFPGDWIAEAPPVQGIARLRAGLKLQAYSRHRHDTYTIAVTQSGVQEFDYRGSVHRSLPGQVVVLHPDEPHDGRPGTDAGFIYLGLHLDPAQVFEAACGEVGKASLPFVANPIMTDLALASVIVSAFDGPLEPLHADELIHTVSHSLLRNGHSRSCSAKRRVVSDKVIGRAREFLEENCTRVVSAAELETACGETRFTVGEQFKRRFGTSPCRFLLMRRLDRVRLRLRSSCNLADLAQQVGFADQAHMTRAFKSAFGTTPSSFMRLCRAGFALAPPGPTAVSGEMARINACPQEPR